MMRIETERLIITEFTMDMAEEVHRNSLDENNRRFLPDEVFETLEEAQETVAFLMSQYNGETGPYVYPVLTKEGENIGYVQLVPQGDEWEIGYHIAEQYTGKGYASEAVKAFLPMAAQMKNIKVINGIFEKENAASEKVMERCGFERVYAGLGDYQGEQRDIIKNIWNA